MSVIFGRKPVQEAINSAADIETLYVQKGLKSKPVQQLIDTAKKRAVKISFVPQNKLNSLTNNKNHQGIAALKSAVKYSSLSDVINYSKQNNRLIVLLDQVQDTHNLGAIIRSAECAGADGIIMTKHHSAPVNHTAVKTSAGAVSHIRLCQVINLAEAIDDLKGNGYWVYGSSLDNAVDYREPDYSGALALVLGNEEKGIRRLTADKCDELVRIPMRGKIDSLNVSVSAGILLFHITAVRKS